MANILTFNAFEPATLVYIIFLLLLLIFSALVSGSETSFFSLSPADVATIKKRENRTDSAILKLLSGQDYLLATILITNNLVNICIVLLANGIMNRLFTFSAATAWEFIIKVVIVTFLLLLFGEIMPKITAAYNPLKFARRMARPLVVVMQIMKPFAWLLVRSSSRLNESVSQRKVNISIDQLSNAIEITKNHSEEERQMLTGIVSFINTEVAEIMKLRMDIVALDIEQDYEQVKDVIINSGFSRIPVFEENLDNIKGILYVKDMLPYINENKDFQWQKFLRKPYFVPELKKINDLLEEFQTNKVHIAIVVDEYGSTMGLVSLEDILEEIVGEITDESDTEEPTFYKKIDDTTYLFDGKTHLADFEKVLNLDEDFFEGIEEQAETLAGMMIEIRRDFLKKGETVFWKDFSFRVTALEGRRIDKIRVIISQS